MSNNQPTTAEAEPARSVAYLGPRGTFTEEALFTQRDLAEMEHHAMSDAFAVLRATQQGEVDMGFVAIENMIDGLVTATLDALAFHTNLTIQREVILDVRLNLIAQHGVSPEEIKSIRTHPVAHAQCLKYLDANFAGVETRFASSTAHAARELAESGDRTMAAIAPHRSAEAYDLAVLDADIEDHRDNQTRFLLVSRGHIGDPSGHDKTSLVVWQRVDKPGSLMGLLDAFASRGVNLTSLQSRPIRKGLGQYCFFVDCEGHIADDKLGEVLRSLYMRAEYVKVLGSYPCAPVDPGVGAGDAENPHGASAAENWLADVRARLRRPFA